LLLLLEVLALMVQTMVTRPALLTLLFLLVLESVLLALLPGTTRQVWAEARAELVDVKSPVQR